MITANESSGSPGSNDLDVTDRVPELRDLLRRLGRERDRCLKYGAQLSRWAMFWTLALVTVGAIVAAQGAFIRIWGSANWISGTFVVLGVFTAMGAGFQSVFKPASRSPQFVEIGLEYDELARGVQREATALCRDHELNKTGGNASFLTAMDDLLGKADGQLRAIQDRELSLYVTGPTSMWRTARTA